MLKTTRYTALALALLAIPNLAWADNASQIQALKDEKALLDAQAQRDSAAAAAANATVELAKAQAVAADIANVIQKAQLDSSAALTKSQIGAQTAQIDALKSTYGAPPNVGNDGNISIADASTGTLLEIKTGSLQVTSQLADKLCKTLVAENITDVYFAPSDLDTKIQSARMVLREFTALSEKVRLKENRELAGLGGVKAQVAPAAILGAVSLLQYGAGALQTVAKLFHSDYAVGLSSDASRAAWLEYFMAATCPSQIPQVQLEATVRNQSLDDVINRLNEMQEFSNAAISKKSSIQKQIDLISARIAALKADKKDTKAFQEQLDAQNNEMQAIVPLDVLAPRIQSLINTVSTTPGAFLDALTWYAFGDKDNGLKIGNKSRLTVALTTQDGQITKTNWLTGKKVYGRSAGELIYRVISPDGKLTAVGYLTGMSSIGRIQFENKETHFTDNEHQ